MSDEAAVVTELGFGIGFIGGLCSATLTLRVRAIEVPEIVVAGKLRLGAPLLLELGGLRKLDKNIFIYWTLKYHRNQGFT